MKNFRNLRTIGNLDYAEVDELGLSWKFPFIVFKEKKLYRLAANSFWRYLDDGSFTPRNRAEDLESTYKARQNLNKV